MLPGMLQYVGTSGAKKIARSGGLERLDQDDSPARAALNKISNKLIRDVRASLFHSLFVHCTHICTHVSYYPSFYCTRLLSI